MNTKSVADGVLAGDPRLIARAISIVETGTEEARTLIGLLFGRTGAAQVVGVTGAPGVGKSTLLDRLTAEWRQTKRHVGILAIDPSSPFTGGAVLGDRIRMQTHAGDDGVFVRSMATRGHLGGLARATGDAIAVLDAAGSDVVLVETVGVGQGEVDIARTADVSVVVTVPGTGDDVQALKAGIMEIGDIFVVNKADREGADRAVSEIQAALMLQEQPDEGQRPPVLKTDATTGSGVRELFDVIKGASQRETTRASRLRSRARVRLQDALTQRIGDRLDRDATVRAAVEALVESIAQGEIDPYTAAARIMDSLSGQHVRSLEPEAWSQDAAAIMTKRPVVLDHVGIAVDDLEQALAFYRDALGLEVSLVEEVPSEQVRAHIVTTGTSASALVELLEATAEDSPIARFVGRRGPGLHHLTFKVENLSDVLTELKRRGVRLIDETPRLGAEGSRIAFVHPTSAHGVLVELKEESV